MRALASKLTSTPRFVEPGTHVAEFDKICEVQSDKASVEITSRYAGEIAKLHYDVNEIAKVGQPLVDIKVAQEESTLESPAPTPAPAPAMDSTLKEAPAPENSAPPKQPRGSSLKDPSLLTLATPAVRRIAKQNSVDLAQVEGTGKDGRVLKEDVMAYLAGGKSSEPAPATKPAAPSQGERTVPLTNIQRAMFKTMTRSLSIPQLGYKDEMELNATTEYRAALNKHIAENPAQYAFKKMSYMPIFIKCLSLALSHYPIMNASLASDDALIYRDSHNIGLAMDTPQGLLVPNIKDVQDKSIFDVAHEIHRLTELGQRNALGPADLKGGTITVSNIGTVGGTYANPVIVSSELAIVALGRMQTLPRFDDAGNVVARQILPISWSADHRVIDGATIARFGNHWKMLVENPILLTSSLR